MGLIDKIIQAFEDDEKAQQHNAALRQRQAALRLYQERYWKIALILWEVTCANQVLLKVAPQKLPKQLATQDYTKPASLNVYQFRLKRTPGNTPCSDSAVLPREIKKLLYNEFLSLNFSGLSIDCEEDTYYYYLIISGDNLVIGRPLSPRIGALFINSFYNADYDQFFPAFDVQYPNSTHGGIKDGAAITLYSEGEFVPSRAMRDPIGGVYLSRRPVCSFGNSYLAVI
jgi:hypothetical protein